MKWPRGVPDDLCLKRGVKGLRWTIAEATAQWLPASLLDNPEAFLLNNPSQKIIKESTVRTALIIPGPHGELFLKQYKTRGVKERLKYFLLPSKAEKEWTMARRALSKGILTPPPLAMAERRKGRILKDGLLITQAIAPSSPLIELIPEGRYGDLLVRAARLIRQTHDVGLFHQDLHAGNILVGGEEENLYVIDLHRSKFLRKVSIRRRLWSLAQFFYSLTRWFSPDDKKVFLHWYDEEGETFKKGFEEGLRRIERMEERIYRRHMKSRTKRCLKNSGGFYLTKKDNWRISARRGWKTEELLKAVQEHKDIVVKAKEGLIKEDRRTAITLFDFMKRRICVKEYRHQGALQRFKEIFRRSKARKGWLMGNGLVVRGIGGIMPQALLERRRRGLRQEAFLIMESPSGYVELDRYMVKTFGASHHGGTRRDNFLKALADFMAGLYLLRITHRDLKTCNIMVTEEHKGWKFGLVDMDDIQLDRNIRKKRFLKELMQLHTSTPLFIEMKDRIRFLIRYLQLTRRDDIRDIAARVIKGSRGRALVYCSPEGDVIMDVDWEKACGSGSQLSLPKKEL